ncbi:hypothetical protein J0895_09255 [Phormidium pseudopriestleyi FRX01]|uniref:Uncharacterized protein n=1 Tax=Phormidium pseudopriestleyi FRX01 TaxID=1759528 RepID=A0ABS3FQ90_9CYAN|nr:hypothetical protein [Phormidium pseudopriestleyi FRX01]
MNHIFLLQPGRWTLEGTWLERHVPTIPVTGKILVAWTREDWFNMVTKLTFPGSDRSEITLQYRGHFDVGDRQYTFVLQHSELGRVEGEGWIAPETIIQRYWVLGDEKKRRSGFETLHRLNHNTYYHSSGILVGHYLTSAMEATLTRLGE